MNGKGKGTLGSTPVLAPIGEKKFWEKLRVVLKEEVRQIAGASREAPGKVAVQGLERMPLYDMDDVRKLIRGVRRSTIYEWIEKGLLKPVKMAGRVYFLWRDIEGLWEKRGEVK